MLKACILKVFIALFCVSFIHANTNLNALQHGDIIFQTSLSSQSKAIQIATKSKYSHCGIIFIIQGNMFVLEAVQPVNLTPLLEWIERGENGHFVAKRLKNDDLLKTSEVINKMDKAKDDFLGKNYDLIFSWDDKELYCSELIYKFFKKVVNMKIGNLQTLEDFDLSNKVVQSKLKERYKNNIPLKELVISPQSIFESESLKTVLEN